MASGKTTTIRLVRPSSGVPWGFRLQGGRDFGTPICIQSVKPSSIAERAGLERGDVLLAINNVDLKGFTHEEVKMTIVRAANDIMFIVSKGGAYGWRPSNPELVPQPVIQSSTVIRPQPVAVPVTQQAQSRMQAGHNRPTVKIVQRPAQKTAVPTVVHAQYNSPMGLYSADNIANTYAMQTKGIQKEMEGVDVARTPLGTKMLGTYQVVESPTTTPSSPGYIQSIHLRSVQIPRQ